MDHGNFSTSEPVITEQHPTRPPASSQGGSRKVVIGIAIAVVLILVILIVGVFLLVQPTTDTARIRDIFIIFMAIESLLLGLTLVILIIQLARLINLLQNEIKPILTSTNETISTLRGTAAFLSNNLVEPVIRMNEYLAAIKRLLDILHLVRR